MRMANEFIYADEDVLSMLDTLLAGRESDWWNRFYEDRTKPCPFFVESPDESLAHWVNEKLVRPGRAVDLGCGNGRNGVFLARRGFVVEGVDYSQKAIDWAAERVRQARVPMQLRCQSVLELECELGSYDLVYDSGCFHHMPPHRRRTYVELVTELLKPGGWFGLTCFRPEGGSGFSDYEVYERRSLGGGLGYTEERLREIWSHGLQVRAIRQMRKPGEESGFFGADFLWVLIAQKMS
jgi:cyclopropane fatty-acyl-phospholipid synthase-like methyltransferase